MNSQKRLITVISFVLLLTACTNESDINKIADLENKVQDMQKEIDMLNKAVIYNDPKELQAIRDKIELKEKIKNLINHAMSESSQNGTN